MTSSFFCKNRQMLDQLMQQVEISSLSELSNVSGISELQLIRLQYGLLPKMKVETLLKLSDVLQVPVNELLTLFCSESSLTNPENQQDKAAKLEALKQEYQRLQQKMEQQQQTLNQQFQQSSLQVLESWLLQWPTAAAAAQNNPELPATRLLPLIKPITELLNRWGVEAIATVGEEIIYNPQWHQLMEGNAEPGDSVKVRYVGYRQGEKLLYRAKVSPISRNRDDKLLRRQWYKQEMPIINDD